MKRILIVDDDTDLGGEMADILRREGYYVDTAFDANSREFPLEGNLYDYIILDHKMPGLSGVDILKLMKGQKTRSKIFLVSGRPFIRELLEKEGLLNVVAGILEKPFDIETLLEKLRAADHTYRY